MTDRRHILKLLAASPVAMTGAVVPARAMAETQAAASVGLITPNVCSLMPEVTEGPYYIDPKLNRSDIREGQAGVALTLRFQVVTADCQPVAGARVDLWHCDAQGNYSGYPSQGSDRVVDTTGQTFLRGTQITDAKGLVAFQTIYPGWYASRTVHVHFKVFLNDNTVLTGQGFFPDALSQYIFDNVPSYGGRKTTRDMVNRTDGIAQQAGAGAYVAVREQPEGYDAALVVGINPDARSTTGRPGGPGGPGRPQGGPPPGPPPTAAPWTPQDLVPGKE